MGCKDMPCIYNAHVDRYVYVDSPDKHERNHVKRATQAGNSADWHTRKVH